MKYFTLNRAQNLIRIIPSSLSDDKLQKHVVKLRDFKGYIDRGDMPRLLDGGYFGIVCDPSASGLVPKDIWLQTNLGSALDEATNEKTRRLNKLASIL